MTRLPGASDVPLVLSEDVPHCVSRLFEPAYTVDGPAGRNYIHDVERREAAEGSIVSYPITSRQPRRGRRVDGTRIDERMRIDSGRRAKYRLGAGFLN